MRIMFTIDDCAFSLFCVRIKCDNVVAFFFRTLFERAYKISNFLYINIDILLKYKNINCVFMRFVCGNSSYDLKKRMYCKKKKKMKNDHIWPLRVMKLIFLFNLAYFILLLIVNRWIFQVSCVNIIGVVWRKIQNLKYFSLRSKPQITNSHENDLIGVYYSQPGNPILYPFVLCYALRVHGVETTEYLTQSRLEQRYFSPTA